MRKHNIDTVEHRNKKRRWHFCEEDDCDYKSKEKCKIKRHKADKHNIGVKWHYCPEDDCDYKCKQKCHIKLHKASKHNIGVKWHYCLEDDCDFKGKSKSHIKLHKANKHNIGVKWHVCPYDTCDYKAKSKSSLDDHKTLKHNVNVKWHHCEKCPKKFKLKNILTLHIKELHNNDIAWHHCEHCIHKSKRKGDMKKHMEQVHDIGDKECVVCFKYCGVLIPYKHDKKQKEVGICRECAIVYGAKRGRIEIKYAKALKEHFDMPFSHDTRVGGNACQSYRPDALFLDAKCKVHIHFELDEYQHKWKSGSYDCDEKRISDIYDEFADIVPDHYVVVRLNPDSYDGEHHDRYEVFEKRFDHLLKILNTVRENPPPHRLSIIYMYYDENNHRIAKNIPRYMVNNTTINFGTVQMPIKEIQQ